MSLSAGVGKACGWAGLGNPSAIDTKRRTLADLERKGDGGARYQPPSWGGWAIGIASYLPDRRQIKDWLRGAGGDACLVHGTPPQKQYPLTTRRGHPRPHGEQPNLHPPRSIHSNLGAWLAQAHDDAFKVKMPSDDPGKLKRGNVISQDFLLFCAEKKKRHTLGYLNGTCRCSSYPGSLSRSLFISAASLPHPLTHSLFFPDGLPCCPPQRFPPLSWVGSALSLSSARVAAAGDTGAVTTRPPMPPPACAGRQAAAAAGHRPAPRHPAPAPPRRVCAAENDRGRAHRRFGQHEVANLARGQESTPGPAAATTGPLQPPVLAGETYPDAAPTT